MRKIVGLLVIVMLAASCNNSQRGKENSDSKDLTESRGKLADSLYKKVMNGHDVGMAKMAKVEQARNMAQRMLDSFGSLPANDFNTSKKAALQSLATELDNANSGMDSWMREFNIDSALNVEDVEVRISYLNNQLPKVERVKDAILNSLQKADSILKR